MEQISSLRGLGWVQSCIGVTAKQTYKQTDRTGGDWVQSPFGVKAEQKDRQTGLAAHLVPL